ncbi:hypothetical protein ABT236_24535 [Streptomyces sp. NPDC001523]|uniref:hypothetical protein n=1 Tax=Streptomyces sp. NPDC001523 TaxID=3154383 RepID=UPI0033342005
MADVVDHAEQPPVDHPATLIDHDRRPSYVAQRALRGLGVIHRYTGGVSRTQIARETGLPQLHLAHAIEHLIRTRLANPVAPGIHAPGSSLRLAESGRTAGALLPETLAFLRDEVGAAVYVAAYTDGEVSITQYADSPTAWRYWSEAAIRHRPRATGIPCVVIPR